MLLLSKALLADALASGSGLTVGNDLARDLPDISLFSGDGYISGSFYVICQSDQDPSGVTCDLNSPYSDFAAIGGTSSAAPTFAGMMALVNQNMAVNHPTLSARQGNANYVLYNLASSQAAAATQGDYSCNSSTSSNPACTFNDITKGNNSVPCVGGSVGCSSVTSAFGIEEASDLNTGAPTNLPAWNTATGLDLSTGLGSVNAFNLVNNWPTAVGAFKPTTTTLCLSTTATSLASCPGPITITHGQTVYVNTTVSQTVNGNTTPIPVSETNTLTEDVSLVGSGGNSVPVDRFTSNNYSISNVDIYPLTNGTTVGQGFCIINGASVGTTFCTQSLVGGSYSVIAHYAGDGTYGASDSTIPIPVTVNPEGSTATVTAMSFDSNGNSISSPVPYGDFTYVRVDVTGATSGQENATGTVNLTDNGVAIVNPTGGTTLNFSLNTEGYLEDQTAFLAVGAHSFKATYGGDASYNASPASAAVALTVVPAATVTTVRPSPSVVTSTQNVTLTAFVDTQSFGKAPTGTVNFYNNGTQIGSVSGAQLVPMLDTNGFVAAQAVLTMTLSSSGSITTTYSGDTNYIQSTSPGVSITVDTVGINLSPAPNTAAITISSPGQTSTLQLITVTGANGFAGTVTLSAAVTATFANAVDLPTCTFGAPDTNFTAPNTITLSGVNTTGTATMTCSSTRCFAPCIRAIKTALRPLLAAWWEWRSLWSVYSSSLPFRSNGGGDWFRLRSCWLWLRRRESVAEGEAAAEEVA